MAGKKSLGSWDSNDKRTKAGKNTNVSHPHKEFDAAVDITGSVIKFGFNALKGKKKPSASNKTVKSNTTSSGIKDISKEETEEEKTERLKKDKKALPFIIIGAIIGVGLVIWFWVWVISLF